MSCQVHVVTAAEESANKYSIYQVSLYEKIWVIDLFIWLKCFVLNNVINLTGAVFVPARVLIEENTCELISTLITNLLGSGNKYSVICSMAMFILKLYTSGRISVYLEKLSKEVDILIFERFKV